MARVNPKIILNNFVYKINNKMADRTYWKCVCYSRSQCKARVTTQGTIARITGVHNHEPTMENCDGLKSQRVSVFFNKSPRRAVNRLKWAT